MRVTTGLFLLVMFATGCSSPQHKEMFGATDSKALGSQTTTTFVRGELVKSGKNPEGAAVSKRNGYPLQSYELTPDEKRWLKSGECWIEREKLYREDGTLYVDTLKFEGADGKKNHRRVLAEFFVEEDSGKVWKHLHKPDIRAPYG